MERVGLAMIREHLEGIPDFPLPAPYRLRLYETGDAARWTAIQMAAEPYVQITETIFRREFGDDEAPLRERQFFLLDGDGLAVGVATAWFNPSYRGRPFGRVHWVAIVPAEQGKGLAKPLLSAVCRRLRDLGHDRAYLMTSSQRVPAISLYLKFGFGPDVRNEKERAAWIALRDEAGLTTLRDMDLEGVPASEVQDRRTVPPP
jgi:GNAT superfamily N-acetyltransferase